MLGLSANLRYFLCSSTIDMRNGFDGLAGIVRNHLKKDPISGDVFVFLNKTRTHIKLLYWDVSVRPTHINLLKQSRDVGYKNAMIRV
jgi:transposase